MPRPLDSDSCVCVCARACVLRVARRMRVQAGTLSGVELPPATYPIRDSLPPSIVRDGVLSSLQLEGCLYACQRHQQLLPNGARAGFFLADGAGVGKGRQLASIIVDSLHRGISNKHVWLSVSTDLHLETNRGAHASNTVETFDLLARVSSTLNALLVCLCLPCLDLAALGCRVNVINGLQAIDAACKTPNWSVRDLRMHRSLQSGTMFLTYSSLVSGFKGQRGKRKESRLEQLVAWCGGEAYEGVLIFDESHRAKNYKPDGKQEASSLTGRAVVKLQEMMPKARVVYASATGAHTQKTRICEPCPSTSASSHVCSSSLLGVTEIRQMAYFTRLGLWGPGCGFDTFATFEKSIAKRGIGAFELLAMELKGIGCYVSRGHRKHTRKSETNARLVCSDALANSHGCGVRVCTVC